MWRHFTSEWSREKDITLRVLLTVLLLFIALKNILKLYQPYVLGDEFGYWANAAYLVGYDWSQMLIWTGYYSYGYSLLLIPIMKLFHNSILIYRAAVVLNACMLCGSFLLACYCGNIWNKRKYTPLIPVAAFLTMLYPSSLVNVNVAWSEICQYFVFWIIVTLVVKCVNSDYIRLSTICLLTLFIGMAYFIHQRNIVLLIMEGLFIVYLLIRHRLSVKCVVTALTTLTVVMLIGLLLKKYLVKGIYSASNPYLYDANNFSGQIDKIKFLMTDVQGIRYLFLNISGRLIYFFISTFGIFVVVMYSIIANMKEYYEEHADILFVNLSFLMSMVVSSIYFQVPERYDNLFYGRYSEQYIGPVLFWGLYKIFNSRKGFSFKSLLPIAIFADVSIYYILNLIPNELANPIKIQFVGFIDYVISGKLDISRLILSLKLILFSAVIVFVIWKRWKYLASVFITAILIFFWYGKTQSMTETILWQQNLYYQITRIELEASKIESPIYCVINDHYDINKNVINMILQFAYMQKTIDVIPYDSMPDKGDALFVQYGKGDIDLEEYVPIYQTENIHGKEGIQLFVKVDCAAEYIDLKEALSN